MSYEFQNTLHQNSDHMCAAIAYEWMTAGGMNSSAAISEILADPKNTAEFLATECMATWDLNNEWLIQRQTTRKDIEYAFKQFVDEFLSVWGNQK